MRKPIQYPVTQAQPLSGVLPPITIREFRGANTYDPLSIDDGFFTDMSNMTADDYPAISVRPGYTTIGTAAGTKVIGMGVWKGIELHAVFSDGTWRKYLGGVSWSTLKSGLDTSADWTFTNYEGGTWGEINLVGCNGVDGLHRYDGSTVQTFGDAPADINFVCTYQNRLWGASGIELHSCALDRPEVWQDFAGTDEDSYVKTIESERGEDIDALSAGLKKLTVGMPNAIVELYGSLPSDFYTISVTDDEGTANNKSTFTQEGVLRFMHEIGIFEYAGGVLPDKVFSDLVKRYIAEGVTAESAAGTDGTKLYFTIPPDTSLVYDPRVQTWGVWHDLKPAHYALLDNELYIGTSDGRVLKLGGETDNGTPISWYAISKPFNSVAIAQRSRWLKMWLTAELAAGSSMEIYLSPSVEGDDWQLVKSISGSGIGAHRTIIPVSQFALEEYVRVKFQGTGWARIHAFTRQVRQLPLY